MHSYPPTGIFGLPPNELDSSPDKPSDFLFPRKSFWAADEGVADLKESQQPADFLPNADAHACANKGSVPYRSTKPKRTVGTQVNSIEPLVDLQCCCKPPRSSRQIQQFAGLAIPLHLLDSFKRLESSQQHTCADSRLFSCDIEHVGRSINEIHVGESRTEKQGAVPCRLSAESMPARVARRISL